MCSCVLCVIQYAMFYDVVLGGVCELLCGDAYWIMCVLLCLGV